jgi:hypothetical protein
MNYRCQRQTYSNRFNLEPKNKTPGVGTTYAPDDLARLTLNDVRSMEHNEQVVEEQSLVFPCDPSVQARGVPW